MHTNSLIVTLLAAMTTALPSPDGTTTSKADIMQGTEVNPSVDMTAMSPLGKKSWLAAGGCQSSWDSNNWCIRTCVGEANAGKCYGWYRLDGVLNECYHGVWTCRCDCQYG
jgi:hypothetical protein